MFIFKRLRHNVRFKKLTTALAVVMVTSMFQVLVKSQYMVEMDKSLDDKALTNHAFRNLTMKSIVECFLACLEDCLCMAFQLCENTECQLLLSNQFQAPAALVTMEACSYYDMVPKKSKQVGPTFSASCTPQCECRVNLCKNGGMCESFFPTDYTTARFKCNCPPGYAGMVCEDVVKSCRGYINGSRVPGIYKVFDDDMNLLKVFCDFDSNSTMAWTLIQSYELQNNLFKLKEYGASYPVNEDLPNWKEYRLSKSRMLSIQEDSSKWRITCKYDTDGVVYRDYLQATNDQFDIMTFDIKQHPPCSLVEWIDIRGQGCKQCTAFLVQSSATMLHSDSYNSQGCEFDPTEGESCNSLGEDNFGFYNCINSDHRCSSSSSATTQTWFGGQ